MPTKSALIFSLLALTACSQMSIEPGSASGGQSASQASRQDAKFMEDIAQANLAEIATGKLAASKAESMEVRRYGQLMVDEHTALMNEGGQLAAKKGMAMPKSPDLKHQAALKKLQLVSGPGFDRAYMEQMVGDHEQTLQLLNQTVAQAGDPELRAHAQKALPHVQHHLQLARRIAGDLVG